MATIVSSLVYTVVDQGGSPRTEGWFLFDHSQLTYMQGGTGVDLSGSFAHVEQVSTSIASGVFRFPGYVNHADLPTTSGQAASLRIQQLSPGNSGVITQVELASGTAMSGSRTQLHVIGY